MKSNRNDPEFPCPWIESEHFSDFGDVDLRLRIHLVAENGCERFPISALLDPNFVSPGVRTLLTFQ